MLSYAPFEPAIKKPSPTVIAAQPTVPSPFVIARSPQTAIECNYVVMAFIVCVILLVLQDSR